MPMMHINLLPVKAARKQVNARQELFILLGVFIAVLAALYAFSMVVDSGIAEAQERVAGVQRELEKVKQGVARVQEFKTKAELFERKLKVVDDLKQKKFGPAHMLDDLAAILTDEKKVWLTRIDEQNGSLTLEGCAMEHQDISEFQRALERRSTLFKSIKLGNVSTVRKEGVSYVEFRLTCITSYTAG
jgi:type IV pilus assembly protein PilN